MIKRIILGMLHTNCYIIYNENSKEACIIDPSTHPDKIINEINDLNIKEVKYIILTHAHSDHILALDKLVEKTNAKVCIGNNDAKALNDNSLSLCSYFHTNAPKTKPDILLKDNDELNISDLKLKILETPGHTVGSISILCDNHVICGDTLFYESVGRTDFETSSAKDLIHSIKNKLFLLPKETVVCPGHGEYTTIEHEINNNPFIW